MIIDAKAIFVTLLVVAFAFVYGLKLIRKFALEIAQENHDAVTAMDRQEEKQRSKKEKAADAAAEIAFSKVEPILAIPSTNEQQDGAVAEP
mmetsp:Transcript_5718/g.14284  ORF Transcript_5718/g.14284 Transcript_5718/m.14284 type:complete len:91 (+) Transcript_5718:80-352(+)